MSCHIYCELQELVLCQDFPNWDVGSFLPFPHSWVADVEEASLVIIWNLTIEMRSSLQDSSLVTFCTLGHHDELTPLLSGRRMDQHRHPLDKENFFSCTFFFRYIFPKRKSIIHDGTLWFWYIGMMWEDTIEYLYVRGAFSMTITLCFYYGWKIFWCIVVKETCGVRALWIMAYWA